MQITSVQNCLSFTADIKHLFDKGLIPEVKRGFYGMPLTKKNVSREHLLPHCKGGTRSEANIVLADKFLNNLRGSKPIKEAADVDTAVEYLSQFKDVFIPEHKFDGNAYIMKVTKTLKRLGFDITDKVKQMMSSAPEGIKETVKHIDFKA